MTTISRHDYSVVLDDGVTILSPTKGQLTLDAGGVPHVEGELTLAVADAALLADLDPRDSRRVTVTVEASFPSTTRTRSFDLGIRDVTPDRAAGTVMLRLASDEAILKDFAQLADDRVPRSSETSLRGICEYVLYRIGAVLDPGPEDADVTAYWKVTNLLFNPTGRINADHWTDGGETTVVRGTGTGQDGEPGYIIGTARSTTGAIYAVDTSKYNLTATPGDPYVFSVYVRTTQACQVRPRIYFLDGANQRVAFIDVPAWVPVSTGAMWTRIDVAGVAPATAAKIAPFVSYQGMTAGEQLLFSSGMLYKGDEIIAAFNGETPAGAGYTYAFAGDPHASASTRTPDIERRPEALVWSAGVSGMAFLEPLLKTAGLRLVCDEQRHWTLRNESYRAAGGQSWRYGVNITAAEESLSRDDESWFDAAVYVYRWTDADGIEQTRTDGYSLALTPTKVLLRELRDTPYPGPGRAQHMVTRAQGKGRSVTVSGIPTWSEHTDQLLAVLLDGTPIQTGISARVRFDFETDEVTITSRTTDTPAAAWTLIPTDEAWLDSPVGESWTEEVI